MMKTGYLILAFAAGGSRLVVFIFMLLFEHITILLGEGKEDDER